MQNRNGWRHGALAALIVTLAACGGGSGGSDGGGDADTTAPTVQSTTPADGAVDVATNSAVTVSFSEAMDCASVAGALAVSDGAGAGDVAGSVACGGNSATFTPTADLAYGTLYTATVTTAATDVAGNALAEGRTWSFTTGDVPDTAAPTVASTAPVAGADAVAINTTVSVNFSEAMDCATLTAASLTLDAGGSGVAGAVGCSGNSATFTPSSDLAYATVYTATVTTAATDLAGNALAADVTWSFTTGAAPDTTAPTVSAVTPTDAATDVEPDVELTAEFSEPMNGTTLTGTSFTLTGPDGAVSGVVSYAATTATFAPVDPLLTNATFTATITTAATDAAGNALAADYTWQFITRPWTKFFGGSSDYDDATALAVDAAGNVYVAGTTYNDLDGVGPELYAGAGDVYVAKFAAVGTQLWVHQFGTGGDDWPVDIAVDGDGTAYVVGNVTGALPGHTHGGNSDIFLAKFAADGTASWTRQIGTVASESGSGVAVDADGAVYLVGTDLTAKYNASGTLLWSQPITGAAVVTDADGVYVASAGGGDMAVAKFDPATGDGVWSTDILADAYPADLAIDGSGTLFVLGSTTVDVDGAGPETSAGGYDFFIASYDGTGALQWLRQYGTSDADYSTGIRVAADGSLYVSGGTDGDLDGAGEGVAAGGGDAFVAKFDGTGATQWIRQFGNGDWERAMDLDFDPDGRLFVGGGIMAGGLDGVAPLGGGDAFIVKYTSDGIRR